jgi:hypothetical protein
MPSASTTLSSVFPWTTKKVQKWEIIVWAKCGWNYEIATSSHHLQGNPLKTLWPNLARFVFDGTECLICQNGFGPKGVMALGSCQYIYHPMCLFSIFLVCRFCALYRSLFHKCLYKLLGLIPYMPPSCKKNVDNTPRESMAMY